MKRKREIDFIAAQKLMGKTNQSTSFEFILVITVFVVACGMVGWYMLARTQYDTKVKELDDAKTTLTNLETQYKKNEKNFNEYQVATDTNGNPVVLSTATDKNGNITFVYKYSTIKEVATEVANSLAAAQSASTDAKATIDLTSSVIKLVYYGATSLKCDVLSFSYTTTGVTVNLSSSSVESKQAFLDYMQGNSAPVAGYEPTRYITGAKISSESSPVFDDNGDATYKFTVTFTVFSDVKPRATENN